MATLKARKRIALLAFVPILNCCFNCFCVELNTLEPSRRLEYNTTLVSAGNVFELGFFTTDGSSSRHYLGIWFKNDPNKKAVWVANRDNPLSDERRSLAIGSLGNLVLFDDAMIPFIVNYGYLATSANTTAKLLDSGNLILVQGQDIIWQSFYNPTDTLLPGMKLVLDLHSGRPKTVLTSWVSPHLPTGGSSKVMLQRFGNTTILCMDGGYGYLRFIGSFNNSFKFVFEVPSNRYSFTYASNGKDNYLEFNPLGNNMSWWVINSAGVIDEFTLVDEQIVALNHSLCRNSAGCLIPMPSDCAITYNFSEIKGKIPSSWVVSGSVRLGPSDCERKCRWNCSCKAYTTLRDDGTGCVFYYGETVRVDLIGKGDQTIYVRVDALMRPEISSSDQQRTRRLVFTIVSPVILLWLIISVAVTIFVRYRKKNQEITPIDTVTKYDHDATKKSPTVLLHQFASYVTITNEGSYNDDRELGKRIELELPMLSFSCLVEATDDFAAENKIGEGGFGPVYKGLLLGYEIAVKRLSGTSGQGVEEFKSEVLCISKLQHRNLVRLLGYCVERREKLLIYEFLPNKSLDSFIFGKGEGLDWRKRVHIMKGIAQGLLYLHEHSRLRIIHRDLKCSNILLDAHMNPRISDFGLARIFDDDKSLVKTTKVAGTYGYMAPEYAAHGIFSAKSDVFSYGVIMLEIISGERNTTYCEPNQFLTLLGHAWTLWNDGRIVELIDPAISNACSSDELTLCVQVALLCVQENPRDRPTMSDVLSILDKERTTLASPKQPAFSSHLGIVDVDQLEDEQRPSDFNICSGQLVEIVN